MATQRLGRASWSIGSSTNSAAWRTGSVDGMNTQPGARGLTAGKPGMPELAFSSSDGRLAISSWV